MRFKLLITPKWSLLVFVLLCPALLFAESSLPPIQLNIKPSLSQAIVAVNTTQILSKNAYSKLLQNKATSQLFYKAYLNDLDPQHTFFTRSDIDTIKAYKDDLLTDLKSGHIVPGFIIFQIYQKRYKEYLNYQLGIIKTGLDKLDLKTDETLLANREKSDWVFDTKAQKKLWKKQLINTVISMKINGKKIKSIEEQLTRRYKNQLKQLKQTKAEDVFQLYINAYTTLYDPHTQYFSPAKMKNFNIDMSLSLEGIGAVLQFDNGYTKVVSIVPGGPADKAGQLKPGDKILGVAQGEKGAFEDVVGMRLDDVVDLIRGPKESTVRLEVMPASQEDKTRVYTIVRNKVKLEEQSAKETTFDVKLDDKNYKIGVLRIPTFYLDFKAAMQGSVNYKSTTRDVRKLLMNLKKEKVDGIIIDLRGNGGGALQEAVSLTRLFIPKGPAVIVKNSHGKIDSQQNNNEKTIYKGPLAVVVNRLSASASEIFAGAMQDYNRAIIIGGRTYGKGTVQTIKPLNSGQIKLTIAKFYRVSGQSTQNKGVEPDIKFPSLIDTKIIGESTQKNALTWDTIKPGNYKPEPTLKNAIKVINKNFIQQEKTSPYFQYVYALKKLNQAYKNQTLLSLNFAERKSQFNSLQEKQLAIENKLRKSKGQAPIKTLKEMEKEQTPIIFSPKKEDPKNDDYLKEAGVIITNYIHYENKNKNKNKNKKVKHSSWN